MLSQPRNNAEKHPALKFPKDPETLKHKQCGVAVVDVPHALVWPMTQLYIARIVV